MAAQDVDAPNRERGGTSTVSLLTLEDEQGQTHRLYLKRQTNHLGRSLSRPLGEPTFSREWRAIRHYHALGIPSVDAGWYGERRTGKEWRAILITFDLDGRDDLDHWHARWPALDDTRRTQVITASARLVRQIHQAGMMHGCLFPKHLFLSRPRVACAHLTSRLRPTSHESVVKMNGPVAVLRHLQSHPRDMHLF
ncbi:lipopolysaccharide kinase InaA family protein [Cobetia sp. ICG0124]|uniref:lipopolysaccharide kinase InaA family protein n=1 Tax=Cobetia sp. ICG0124 TaxID=2053669 RepID=UPI0013E35BCC|nr:lipopolysaccharide kinase InaA family protein [Cobetia sp. ICG0124]